MKAQIRLTVLTIAVIHVVANATSVVAQTPVRVVVSGRANIYGSGLTIPPAPGGGGGGILPVSIRLSTLGNPAKLNFPSVSGTLSAGSIAGSFNGPDGGRFYTGRTNITAWKGISGIQHQNATMYLVGVFLGPTGQPVTPPPVVNVTNANNTTVFAPLLGQQFFIGDGRTRLNVLHEVRVPKGATQLYLGIADAFSFGSDRPNGRWPGYYNDNRGSLTVVVAAKVP